MTKLISIIFFSCLVGCGVKDKDKLASQSKSIPPSVLVEPELSAIAIADVEGVGALMNCDSLDYYLNIHWNDTLLIKKVIRECSVDLFYNLEKRKKYSVNEIKMLGVLCKFSDGELTDQIGGIVKNIAKERLSDLNSSGYRCLHNRLIGELKYSTSGTYDMTAEEHVEYKSWLYMIMDKGGGK